MDVVYLSDFEKISGTGTLSVYFKKIGNVEGLIYNVDAVFGKTDGKPYDKVPMIKGHIFVDDPFGELHEKYWNEKGYHFNLDELPKYRYYFGIFSFSGSTLYSVGNIPQIVGSLQPFFGDIKK